VNHTPVHDSTAAPAGRVARYRSLDSLRGFGALLVVVHHLARSLPEALQERWRIIALPLLMGGRFAVMLFFVLSGFVLALPYFTGVKVAYLPYLVRRFFRLYPPFAFAVLVSALLCFLLGGQLLPAFSSWLSDPWSTPVTSRVVAAHLLTVGIKDYSISLDTPIWSVIVEMRVSLLFPLLVWYTRRLGWPGIAVAVVAAFACAKAQAAIGESTAYVVADSTVGALLLTGRYLVLFLLGVILAARLNWVKTTVDRLSPKLHAIVFILMVFTWLTLAYERVMDAHRGYVDIFFGVFTMYLIGLCVTYQTLSARLSGRISQWLGNISYSLYLIHMPALMAVVYLMHRRASLLEMLAVAFPATLVAGHVMHYLIERPSMALGRKLSEPTIRK
jgi:peptidoglycan/LPS O-acetylase OafA/YrhL